MRYVISLAASQDRHLQAVSGSGLGLHPFVGMAARHEMCFFEDVEL